VETLQLDRHIASDESAPLCENPMSAIANIAAYDGAATPVLHTLLPVSVTREAGVVEALYRENVSGVPVYAQVWCKLRLSISKAGIYRAETRVVVPVMESVSGQNAAGYTAAPKVAYELSEQKIAFFHERADNVGRKLLQQLALNIGGGVTTSVTPVTTGPVAELYQLLVMPT
jgi:hypothetical protein